MLTQSNLSFKENKESSVSQIVNPESIFKMFVTCIDQINDKNEVDHNNLVRLDSLIQNHNLWK